MPVTRMTIFSTAMSPPKQEAGVLVEVKGAWSDDWQIRPDLEFVRAHLATAQHDLGSCQLRRLYGDAKSPHQGDFETRHPIDLDRWWVRIRLATTDGLADAWLGRIFCHRVNAKGFGPDGALTQEWIAYSPLYLLQRIHVSQSFWYRDGAERLIGWVPDMNYRDKHGLLVGNRSTDAHKINGVYLYGDEDLWTARQYLDYLLGWFVDESAESGPLWTLGGELALLDNLTEPVPMRVTQTVAEILNRLVAARFGLDYRIEITNAGFEIQVFSLVGESASFGGVDLPKNPNTVDIDVADNTDCLRIHVVESSEHRYGTIRVLGGRAVCCLSLSAGNIAELVRLVIPGLEEAYLAGTGNAADPADKHDDYRKRPGFELLYGAFAVPSDWDHQAGAAAPTIDSLGNLAQAASTEYQSRIKSTLSWIPVQGAKDFSTWPPTSYIPLGQQTDMQAPLVFLKSQVTGRYFSAELAGIAVSVNTATLGVTLVARPPHLLALNHFEGAAVTEVAPAYDYEDIVATLAVETDQRLRVEYRLPEAKPTDGVLEISAPDAELWYLAPYTAYDIDGNGGLARTPPDSNRVIRDDRAKLYAIMAGAIARYGNRRGRATIEIKGLVPYGGLLGHILGVIEAADHARTIAAPITAVEWSNQGEPVTTLRAGFAL